MKVGYLECEVNSRLNLSHFLLLLNISTISFSAGADDSLTAGLVLLLITGEKFFGVKKKSKQMVNIKKRDVCKHPDVSAGQ